MSCGLWRPVEPLHESIHCYNFNAPDPPPNDPPVQSKKVKLRKKPQQQQNNRDIGEIVESIILNSDRFYNQTRLPCRREFTLSGVRRVARSVCLENNNNNRRHKSFLWDDWNRKSLPSSVLDNDDDVEKIALLNQKAKHLSDSLIKHDVNGQLISTNSLDLKKVCEDFILAEKYAYFITDSRDSNHDSQDSGTKTTFSSMKTLGSDNVFYPQHNDAALTGKTLSNCKEHRFSNSSINSSPTLSINFDNIRVDGFNNKVVSTENLYETMMHFDCKNATGRFHIIEL